LIAQPTPGPAKHLAGVIFQPRVPEVEPGLGLYERRGRASERYRDLLQSLPDRQRQQVVFEHRVAPPTGGEGL
jgi:hypothetical protein